MIECIPWPSLRSGSSSTSSSRRTVSRAADAASALLRLLRHREEIVARDLADELGMVAVDVLLGVREQFLVGLAADDAPALTIDQPRHRSPPSVADAALSAGVL